MPAEESLQSLELGAMFGCPLTALIDAQCQAAEATLRFVRTIGFSGEQPLTVPFLVPSRGSPEEGAQAEPARIAVPLLTLIPIPCVRVKEANIEFRAKILAAQPNLSGERGQDQVSASPIRLRTAFAHRRQSDGADHSRSYSLHVQMRAVQDELPEGLERLLSRLEAPPAEPRPQATDLPVSGS